MTTWKESKARVDAMPLSKKLIIRFDAPTGVKKGKMSLDVSESSYAGIKAITELTGLSLSDLVSELCRSAKLKIVFSPSAEARLGNLRERRERVMETLIRTMVSEDNEENVQIPDEFEVRGSSLRWCGMLNPSRMTENWVYDIYGPRCLTGHIISFNDTYNVRPKITVDRKYENILRGRMYLSDPLIPPLPGEFIDQLKLYAIAENEFTESLRPGVDYTVSLR